MFHSMPTLSPAPRGRPRHAAIAVIAGLLALCLLLPGPACASRPRVSAQTVSVPGKPIVGRLFAPNSVWNEPVPANAPLDRASARLVAHFARRGRRGGPRGDRTLRRDLRLHHARSTSSGRSSTPSRVAIDTDQTTSWVTSLQGASNAVPVPPRRPALSRHRRPDHDLPAIHRPALGVLALPSRARRLARHAGAARSTTCRAALATTRPSSWNGALSIWGASANEPSARSRGR